MSQGSPSPLPKKNTIKMKRKIRRIGKYMKRMMRKRLKI
jgi:hypothetical protein